MSTDAIPYIGPRLGGPRAAPRPETRLVRAAFGARGLREAPLPGGIATTAPTPEALQRPVPDATAPAVSDADLGADLGAVPD